MVAASLTVWQRRRARRLAYWNGLLWSIGNGLTSTTLIVYLALELNAPRIGLGISMLLAVRHVVGVLRLATPALIGRWFDRKRFCLGSFFLSAVLLLGIPVVAAPGRLRSAAASLTALVVLWCCYNLLEYLGTIALWSWLGDLASQRLRGRFLGRRERWMVGGTALAALTSGLFAWKWQQLYPKPLHWVGYAIPAVAGAAFMLAALAPLARMPRLTTSWIVRRGATLRAMLAPLADRQFRRLLAFGCWFSFFNGVTQSLQNLYPASVAGVGLLGVLSMQTGMRVGQWGVSPWLGRLADRVGNRPVLVASQLIAAAGLLFFLPATRQQPWWLAGAWAAWIAYAGLNICLPNLMLRLSPGGTHTAYIATYFAVTGLCYAASTMVGGQCYDQYRDRTLLLPGLPELDFAQCSFLAGWVLRSVGVLLLVPIVESSADSCRNGSLAGSAQKA